MAGAKNVPCPDESTRDGCIEGAAFTGRLVFFSAAPILAPEKELCPLYFQIFTSNVPSDVATPLNIPDVLNSIA